MPAGRARLSVALALVVGPCAPAPSQPAATPSVPAATPSAQAATTSPTSPTPTPQGSLDRAGEWRDDLAQIIPALERVHPDPYHGTPKPVIEAAIEALAERAGSPTITDDELLAGTLQIAALVSAQGCDGHTGAFPWGVGSYPLESMPLRLWLFGDDVVIVDALPPYEDLVGSTIVEIEGNPITDVRLDLAPLIPRDNAQTVRLLTPRFLLIPQVLRGLQLIVGGPVTMRVERGGAGRFVEVVPVPMSDYNRWAGPYGLHLPADEDVRYLSNIDDDLWWERLPDGTLYVQLNRVERIGADFIALRAELEAGDYPRVVLDLRHNFGGEASPIDTIVAAFADPAVTASGGLIVVTGRNSFSAATLLAARLEARTDATFVGEPMSGCPTFYADVEELRLPHSGIGILIAGTLEVGVDPADPRDSIALDAEILLTQEDWEDGLDPVLESLVVAGP